MSLSYGTLNPTFLFSSITQIHFSINQVTPNPASWEGYGPVPPPYEPPPPPAEGEEPPAAVEDDKKVKGHWNDRLTSFQKLMLVKCFMEEKVCSKKLFKKH